MSTSVWYKENCAASDLSVTVTTTAASLTGRACIREYAGGKTSAIIDANGKAENETNVTTSAASCSSGTTGTRSQANGLGIAIVSCDNGSNIANDAWSKSWTNQVYENRSTSGGFRIAELAITSTGAQETTLTLSTSDQNYGTILILDEVASSATSLPSVRAFPRAILNF
jgi:hypothetical protein